MTAQFSDGMRYQEKNYALAGDDNGKLFDVSRYGIEPVGFCSACWRGSLCEYEVIDDQLYLMNLILGLPKELADKARNNELRVGGVMPGRIERPNQETMNVPATANFAPSALFPGLREPVLYSGTVRIGRSFIDELYVHGGFHPAHKYREVFALTFQDGRLIEAVDISDEMDRYRANLPATGNKS